MQFLVITRRRTEKFADADFGARLPDEMQQVRKLYVDGFIRNIWVRADMPGAALVLEAADEATARQGLETLPLVQAEMLEVVLLTALKPYAGFGPR